VHAIGKRDDDAPLVRIGMRRRIRVEQLRIARLAASMMLR
jgi:hypothetical protein